MEAVIKIFQGWEKKPTHLIIGIGFIVGALVCWEAHTILNRSLRVEDPRYLVALRDLEVDHPISFIDFTLRVSEEAVPGAISDQELHLLKGAKVKSKIRKGEIAQFDKLILSAAIGGLAKTIPKGYKAYPIRSSNRLAVRPGDRIDILLKPEKTGDIPIGLLESVLVLELRSQEGDEELVVAASVADIQLLENAGQHGKLVIALRSSEDSVDPDNRRERSSFLRTAKRKKSIEVLTEE